MGRGEVSEAAEGIGAKDGELRSAQGQLAAAALAWFYGKIDDSTLNRRISVVLFNHAGVLGKTMVDATATSSPTPQVVGAVTPDTTSKKALGIKAILAMPVNTELGIKSLSEGLGINRDAARQAIARCERNGEIKKRGRNWWRCNPVDGTSPLKGGL